MPVKRRVEQAEDLNLVPVMNLVTILIPFLLMAAEFVSLAVIDSTLPAIGPPQPVDEEPDKPPLNLSLAITEQGITVLGADLVLHPDGAPPVVEGEIRPPTVPCTSGGVCTGLKDYDWTELTRILALIKDEYPDDENVILVPDQRTKYELVVKAMDASREDSDNRGPDGEPRLLFPFVVIAGGAIN
ncbi:MAG: biopolymer transporter ExbD [Oligoflexia bacterium]|nr:biopolymer transporter ExbD [Oligoflexia bacterium]